MMKLLVEQKNARLHYLSTGLITILKIRKQQHPPYYYVLKSMLPSTDFVIGNYETIEQAVERANELFEGWCCAAYLEPIESEKDKEPCKKQFLRPSTPLSARVPG